MPRDKWQLAIEELTRDNTSGAAEIEYRATEALLQAVSDSHPEFSAHRYRRWLLHLGRDLIAAQPAMANMFRLINDLLWACEDAVHAQDVRQAAIAFLQDRQMREAGRAYETANIAAEYLAHYENLMTYSRSSTVLSALQLLAEKKQIRRVFLSEARPMFEGQTLASELDWAGHRVVLGTDMALFGWLPDVEALVVGADSLSTSGVVNKVGTAALAAAAVTREVPVLVVCTTTKFLPENYVVSHGLREGDPEELMPTASETLTVRNPYFDLTPLEAVTAVITEEGILAGNALLERLQLVRIHPNLRGKQDG